MKKILELWPIAVELIFLFPLNVSWIVVPVLRLCGVVGAPLFLTAVALATAGLLYGWWFWGWTGREIKGLLIVKETIDLGKEISGRLKEDSYIRKEYFDWIKRRVVGVYEKATNENNWLARLIKRNNYLALAIFILAEAFLPGARETGVILCRAVKWKRGFAVLLLLNALNMALTVWSWSYFISKLGY